MSSLILKIVTVFIKKCEFSFVFHQNEFLGSLCINVARSDVSGANMRAMLG